MSINTLVDAVLATTGQQRPTPKKAATPQGNAQAFLDFLGYEKAASEPVAQRERYFSLGNQNYAIPSNCLSCSKRDVCVEINPVYALVRRRPEYQNC